MDLEELELRFRANYGDVIQKIDELTNLIVQKTGDMQYKMQNNLDKFQQSMNERNTPSYNATYNIPTRKESASHIEGQFLRLQPTHQSTAVIPPWPKR